MWIALNWILIGAGALCGLASFKLGTERGLYFGVAGFILAVIGLGSAALAGLHLN